MIDLFSPALQFFIIFGLGLCIGSFLNVVIVRWPRRGSILRPGSRCGFCRSSIPGWANIPVLSFLATGGSCVKCGHAYSIRYPLVELTTAVMFLVVWSLYGWSFSTVLFCGFSAALIAMSFIDIEFRIIPDEISLGGWALALFVAALPLKSEHLLFSEALGASLVAAGSLWILSRAYYWIRGEEGLGGGDIKLMGFVGALLGYEGVLTTLLVGAALGGLIGLVWILVFRRSRYFPIPFGPFLALGAWVRVLGLDSWVWETYFGGF